MIDLRTFILVDGMEDEVGLADVRWYARQLEQDLAAANALVVATIQEMLHSGEIISVRNGLVSADPWNGTPAEISARIGEILTMPNERSETKLIGDQDFHVIGTDIELSPQAIEHGKAYWREHQQEWDDLFPDL